MRHLVTLLSLLIVGTNLYAQDTRGPIETHSPTIFQLSSGDFIPVGPLSLKEDETEIRLMSNWSNTFTVAKGSIVDHEILHVRPSLWYGMTDDLMIGVSMPFNIVGGGYMDSLIESFHDAIGVTNDRNDYDQRNDFRIGTTHYHSATMLGDMMLSMRYKLAGNDNYGVILGGQIQIPTSTRTAWFHHSSVGLGLSLSTFCDLGDFRFFLAASYARIGSSEIAHQKMQPDQVIALWGVDYRVSDSLSFVAQWINMSSNTNFDDYDRWSTEVTVGARYKLSDWLTTEVAFTENLFVYRNSADFGIHCGLIYKLQK